VRRLGRRARVAHARRDFQRAEFHGFVDGNFERGNAARHLVECGKHGDLVLDDLGPGRFGEPGGYRPNKKKEEGPSARA
jgi:hypothetical protein